MRYITDRKRAQGRGASGTGTEHHWLMTVSAVGLAVLTPAVIYIFGISLGSGYEKAHAIFSHPFAAITTAIALVIGLDHFRRGAQMMIEDYLHGLGRKIAVIAVIALSWFLMACGLFALARIAL